jgi:hypothetical protein
MKRGDLFVVSTIGFIQLYVLGHCPAGSAGACLVQCNRAPDGGRSRSASKQSTSAAINRRMRDPKFTSLVALAAS